MRVNFKINKTIDLKKLSHIVFSDKKKLQKLNSIIHPILEIKFNKWCEKQTSKYIIKESALLYETKNYKFLDKTILVYAPKKLRVNRIIDRDNKSIELINKVIKNQIPFKKVENKADYIINNDKNKLLTPQVIKLHEELNKL